MRYEILLVEDDMQIREIITDYFSGHEENRIEIVCAYDGNEGMVKIMEKQYDLIILDIMLPGADGFELCRMIRKRSTVPVIFITARGQVEDKLYGYKIGCDDYIVKPFLLEELYAKVNALLKRASGMVIASVICVGEIELNPSACTVAVKGEQVELTPKEYSLLKYLMLHKGMTVNREQLLMQVWGYDYEGGDRVVDNHIKKLRKHLGEDASQIKTIYTKGYRMEEK